ncbi:MAG: hypothetical protein K2O34_04410 [Acetatifactor sp.]|nr:hypothetical protein [Acetatifactor sp.]
MRKDLEQALEQIRQGRTGETAKLVEQIKALPRDEKGVFDLSSQEDASEIRRILYPVYAAYETECNKKEGYPDILLQMRIMNQRLQEQYNRLEAALYMDMSLRTLMYMSQEIYECYRELMDLYKENVRRFIREFYKEEGTRPGAMPADAAETLFTGSLMSACREHILLAEKYERYYAVMSSEEACDGEDLRN